MSETRVLIAEDNELVSLTLEEQLSNLGYTVVGVARTGTEAVRLCTDLSPDIVIMDMQMPELGGDAAAQQIARQHPTPVIMLTAYSDSEHIRKAESSGALGYLVKPINPEELPPAIDVAIARFREMQRLREQVDTRAGQRHFDAAPAARRGRSLRADAAARPRAALQSQRHRPGDRRGRVAAVVGGSRPKARSADGGRTCRLPARGAGIIRYANAAAACLTPCRSYGIIKASSLFIREAGTQYMHTSTARVELF
jgi:two-component system, response regulator PdtaR